MAQLLQLQLWPTWGNRPSPDQPAPLPKLGKLGQLGRWAGPLSYISHNWDPLNKPAPPPKESG